jgi:hypothetical protein
MARLAMGVKIPHLERVFSALWQAEDTSAEGKVASSPHGSRCVDGHIGFRGTVDRGEKYVANEPV